MDGPDLISPHAICGSPHTTWCTVKILQLIFFLVFCSATICVWRGRIAMKFSAFCKRKLRASRGFEATISRNSVSLDLREEYANAFRTESYTEFWTRVLNLTAADIATCSSLESTAAARLSSYRLFAEHLLDPDQPTITKILASAQSRNRPENHSLLSDYFSETANASLLCGLLLKDIEQTRLQYRPLKTTLQTAQTSPGNCSPSFVDQLSDFSKTLNPFCSSASSPLRFQTVQAVCAGLLKRLESSREKARAKLRLVSGLKRGLSIVAVALTASVAIIAVCVAAQAFVVFISVPTLLPASFRLSSTRRLAQVSAQLDAAVKGTYILCRDLDTISRLVARLHDELEHVRTMVRFCLERRNDWLQPTQEVVRELRKNNLSFVDQLNELEEHLYLCFMTINRARNLVMKEVLELSWV
ncbi:UPF0496 protein 3-like [Magnolia sinica]|uniref:UPF0496 protein 3-like n=1 Tax=Magnolia sinica TaxID=86752 RepID=UPI00265B54FA|nr:UPF0496 protein 3-like [Magnolia sinica]